MKKKVLSLSLFFLNESQPTEILLKRAELVCARRPAVVPCQWRRAVAWNPSPASPSLRTWTGSCCLGSSCAASSARPDTSPDSPLCSCSPPGISSGQPAGETESRRNQDKRAQIKSLWSRLICSRLREAIYRRLRKKKTQVIAVCSTSLTFCLTFSQPRSCLMNRFSLLI